MIYELMTASPTAEPITHRRRGTFTPEQARIAAAKSHEAQRMRKLALSVAQPAQEPQDKPQVTVVDDYLMRRLSRVRYQLDMIDSAIQAELKSDETDGQQLNWLCAAQERLSDQERELNGRPRQGTLKPTSRSPRQSRSGNSMPEPTPIE